MRLFAPAALALLLAPPAHAAPDIADFFPAGTLAYVELTRPGDVAGELKSLFRGSMLEDILPTVNKLRDRPQTPYFNEILYNENEFFSMLGTMLGPEMLTEAKRFDGAAVALVGFTSNHRPDVVVLLRAGESQVPGLLMRSYLTSDNTLRVVGQAEGVSVYQQQNNQNVVDLAAINGLPGGEQPKPQPPKPQPGVPTYAYFPGSVIAGTSFEAVADVIKRIKGKEKAPALSGLAAFREAAALRSRPGLFVFAEPKDLLAKFEAAHKSNDEAAVEPFEMALTKELLNPKSLRSFAASFSPQPDRLDLKLVLNTDPATPCPLLEILAEGKAGLQVPPALTGDAWLSLSLALPAGEDRWKKLVALGDAVAKANGGLGMTPGEAVLALKEKLPANLAPEQTFGKVTGVTLMMPVKPTLPEGAMPLPLVVFTAADGPAAQALEGLVPELTALLSGEKAQPVAETIKGQRVLSLAAQGLPWKSALHIARRGTLVAVGQDRQAVAAAVSGAATPVVAVEGSAAVGTWQWAPVFDKVAQSAVAERKRIIAQIQAQMGGVPTDLGGDADAPVDGDKPKKDEKKPEDPIEKSYKDFTAAAKSVPGVQVALVRQGGQLRLEAKQPRQGDSAKLVDGLVHLAVGQLALRSSSMPEFGFGGPRFFGGGGIGFPFNPGGGAGGATPAPEDANNNNPPADGEKKEPEKKDGDKKDAEKKDDPPATPEKKQ
jgi:hypothetical protein